MLSWFTCRLYSRKAFFFLRSGSCKSFSLLSPVIVSPGQRRVIPVIFCLATPLSTNLLLYITLPTYSRSLSSHLPIKQNRKHHNCQDDRAQIRTSSSISIQNYVKAFSLQVHKYVLRRFQIRRTHHNRETPSQASV